VTMKKSDLNYDGFKVRTADSMKGTIFWDVAPCSLIEFYRRFGGISCLHLQGIRKRSVSTILHGATFLKIVLFNLNYYYKTTFYRSIRPTPAI
jgi:hypothetical protein